MPLERPLPLSGLTASNHGERRACETGAALIEEKTTAVTHVSQTMTVASSAAETTRLKFCSKVAGAHTLSPKVLQQQHYTRDATKPQSCKIWGAPGGMQWH